jgi:NAD(P)H-hydrate epimerase
MCITDPEETYSSHFQEGLTAGGRPYKTIGIGPGLGTAHGTAKALELLLAQYRQPMVIDADALNIIAEYPFLLQRVPPGSLLTPHPKEFERIFGGSRNDFERLELLSQQAVQLHLYILLKGRYTAIACPDGSIYFNSTGNPGMATGGSGDVLTGILTGMLAQGYAPKAAVLLGTYLHGLAGDIAAARMSQEAMTAESIIDCLGPAFLQL